MKLRVFWWAFVLRAIIIGPVWVVSCSLNWLSDRAQRLTDWLAEALPAAGEWIPGPPTDEDYDL